MRVLVAPDKFKGTLTAEEVCESLANALRASGHVVDALALADGGDGTASIVLQHGFAAMKVPVVDGLGRPRTGLIARRSDEALIEMAQVCGLATVSDVPRDPWRASSLGLGLAALAAREAGATSITLALGGSASIDGGVGLLAGLGFVVRDRRGQPVTPDLAGMAQASSIQPIEAGGSWRVLADVSSPLVGPLGAVRAFGPQKGLESGELGRVSAAMCRWAGLLERAFGIDVARIPGGGAAGGVAAAARAALGATIESGADYVADLTGLRERVRASDLVVTGEGAFDGQTFAGKGPGLVIDLARELGRPVHVVAGVTQLTEQEWRDRGVAGVVTCSEVAGSSELARRESRHWLDVAAGRLARGLDPALDTVD